MAEEIAFKNGRISNFERLVTQTLTLYRIILHTIVHHLLTSTYKYMPNFIEIEEIIFVDRRTYVRTYATYVCTYARTDRRTFETGFIRSTLSKTLSKSRPKDIVRCLITGLWRKKKISVH